MDKLRLHWIGEIHREGLQHRGLKHSAIYAMECISNVLPSLVLQENREMLAIGALQSLAVLLLSSRSSFNMLQWLGRPPGWLPPGRGNPKQKSFTKTLNQSYSRLILHEKLTW